MFPRFGSTSFLPGFAKGSRMRRSAYRPYFGLSQEAQEQALQDTAFADVCLFTLSLRSRLTDTGSSRYSGAPRRLFPLGPLLRHSTCQRMLCSK